MIRALKKKYPLLAEYLLAAGVGLSVSFIGILLWNVLLLEQQAVQTRISAEEHYTAKLDRIVTDAATVMDKVEQAIEPTARRPYFSHAGSELSGAVQQQRTLSVSVQNSAVVADDMVSQILVLDQELDPSRAPIHIARLTQANPVGPNGVYTHYWMVPPAQMVPPAFVVFQLQYTDTQSAKRHAQTFFLKFLGESHASGRRLFSASREEKARIERYVQYRRTPLL